MSTYERLLRFETAQAVLDFLIAGYSTKIREEKARPQPDENNIAIWQSEQAALFTIDRDLHLDDAEGIERVLSIYPPKVRALFLSKISAN